MFAFIQCANLSGKNIMQSQRLAQGLLYPYPTWLAWVLLYGRWLFWHGICYTHTAYGWHRSCCKKFAIGARFPLTGGTKIWYNRRLDFLGGGGVLPKYFSNFFHIFGHWDFYTQYGGGVGKFKIPYIQKFFFQIFFIFQPYRLENNFIIIALIISFCIITFFARSIFFGASM